MLLVAWFPTRRKTCSYWPCRYPLSSQRFTKSKAKLLCCFRLIPPSSPEPAEEFPAPEFGPNYAPYDLRIFVVGKIRITPPWEVIGRSSGERAQIIRDRKRSDIDLHIVQLGQVSKRLRNSGFLARMNQIG